MSLLVDNTLSGEAGEEVTNGRLSDSAVEGTVTIRSAGERAVYSETHTVHGEPGARLGTGAHREETPRLRVDLPSSGPWCARWYVWHPSLQDAGHGTNEARVLARLGDAELVTVETGAGAVAARLQPQDLAAEWDSPTVGGTNRAAGQWLRMELRRGGGSLELRIFELHATSEMRTGTWSSPPSPAVLDLTGYRYRRRPLLEWGDQGSQVTDLQNELIDLGYDLGQWGPDGDFGDATFFAVEDFQDDVGMSGSGSAGPETRAAMDVSLGLEPPPLWVSHVALSDGDWIGPAELPEEPPETVRGFTVGMPI